MTEREKIIKNYIAGYNEFDTHKMVTDLDDNIVFENIQNGVTYMSLTGLTAFRQQAEQAKAYFSERIQTIKSFKHSGNVTEIEVDYYAIAGRDFPNGLQMGQELNLPGKSIFVFKADRIIKLTDIS